MEYGWLRRRHGAEQEIMTYENLRPPIRDLRRGDARSTRQVG
jgi:hypothetical protein